MRFENNSKRDEGLAFLFISFSVGIRLFLRELNLLQSTTDGIFAHLSRPSLRHLCLRLLAMLFDKCSEGVPISNLTTVALLITLFGPVVSVLLIALVPLSKRVAVDVERFTN